MEGCQGQFLDGLVSVVSFSCVLLALFVVSVVGYWIGLVVCCMAPGWVVAVCTRNLLGYDVVMEHAMLCCNKIAEAEAAVSTKRSG
jgi:hypothetical protein